MPSVKTEALSEGDPCALAALARPALHGVEVVIDAVVLAKPRALAPVSGEHLLLLFENRFDIHHEIRLHLVPVAVHTPDWIHQIQVGNSRERRRRLGRVRDVVSYRRAETRIPHQEARRLVIGHVVSR